MHSAYRLPIAISLACLFSLNLFMVLSQSPELLAKQMASWVIGLGLFFVGHQIIPKNTKKYQWLLFGLSCIFILLPIVSNLIVRGSRRWLYFGGLSLQPSELVKPLLLLFLVNANQPLLLLIPALLIALQPDLGSALSLLSLTIPSLLNQTKYIKICLLAFVVITLASPLIWKFGLHDYQRHRIVYFLEPQKDPLNKGYNLIQSMIAIGSGGLVGHGFKQGSQGQLSFLPEKHTDFMFASLSEELGLVGIIILLASYTVLVVSLIKKAYTYTEKSHSLFTLSIAALIWFQVFVNVGMNLGLLPVTGIPLPFVSVGGSSIMSLLFSLGIIFSA